MENGWFAYSHMEPLISEWQGNKTLRSVRRNSDLAPYAFVPQHCVLLSATFDITTAEMVFCIRSAGMIWFLWCVFLMPTVKSQTKAWEVPCSATKVVVTPAVTVSTGTVFAALPGWMPLFSSVTLIPTSAN